MKKSRERKKNDHNELEVEKPVTFLGLLRVTSSLSPASFSFFILLITFLFGIIKPSSLALRKVDAFLQALLFLFICLLVPFFFFAVCFCNTAASTPLHLTDILKKKKSKSSYKCTCVQHSLLSKHHLAGQQSFEPPRPPPPPPLEASSCPAPP